MNVVGIIAEYNPFHNGHQWHLNKAKALSESNYAITVMSGNFVQRGEPAIFDKWLRAEMAVRGGVDLVIELPVVFSVRSAQDFAAGGIRLLHALGLVSHVCFGAELADIHKLKTISKSLDNPAIISEMKKNLQNGGTYATALTQAIRNYSQDDTSSAILRGPNNILAIEYLRAINQFAPTLIPLALPRQYAQHNDSEIVAAFASASAIRTEILEHCSMTHKLASSLPITSSKIIDVALQSGRGPVTFQAFSKIVLSLLRMASPQTLQQIPYIAEGLENKLLRHALEATSIEELFTLLKSKRYPFTRLQRIIVHALLQTKKTDIISLDDTGPLYARILAFNQNGRQLLKKLTATAQLPIITKLADHYRNPQQEVKTAFESMLATDIKAGDIYALGRPNSAWRKGHMDYHHSPMYIS